MIDQIKHWHASLPPRDMWMLNFIVAVLFITLFYLLLWEPLHKGLDNEQTRYDTQQSTLDWMQQAAREARQLQSSGHHQQIKLANKAITLVLEQSIVNAGLKSFVGKIESSGNTAARVKLNNVSFNQMLVWLNTIETHNGISVSSAIIERSGTPGNVNARLSFIRP